MPSTSVIKEIEGSTQRVVDVTDEGKRIIDDIEPVEEEFGIGYVYDLRPELKQKGESLTIPTSRDFCIDLLRESRPSNWRSDEVQEIGPNYTGKVWTLEEIQRLGNARRPQCLESWRWMVGQINPLQTRMETGTNH